MSPETALPRAYRLSEGQPRAAVADALPRCVFIEVTNRCNLRCTTCPRTYYTHEPPKDLSLAEFEAIVAQFPELERAVLHGIGEPLLHRELPTMIAQLKARGATVLFNSNGTLLDRAIGEALIASGLDEYRLSLDAADREMYQRVRGLDLFHRVVANMEGFVALKRRMNAELPRISIWCMGLRENLEHLPRLIAWAAEVGVPEVYLQRLTYFGQVDGRKGLAQEEQALFGRLAEREAAIIAQCERQSREMGIMFQASGATDPSHSVSAATSSAEAPWRACRRPWTTAYITANGNALPCCISPFATTDYGSLVMGNVFATPFREIWSGAPYRAWRQSLLSQCPPEACSGCGVHWSL